MVILEHDKIKMIYLFNISTIATISDADIHCFVCVIPSWGHVWHVDVYITDK